MNIKTLEYFLQKQFPLFWYTYTEKNKIHKFQSADFLSDSCQKK